VVIVLHLGDFAQIRQVEEIDKEKRTQIYRIEEDFTEEGLNN